jgi:hypothetical protein
MSTDLLTFPPEIASRGTQRALVRAAADALNKPAEPVPVVAVV